MLRRCIMALAVLACTIVAPADQADAARPSPGAEARLADRFASRGLRYPPRSVMLIALKSEARLELWAEAESGWTFVRSYLVQAMSGRLGPKLRHGDHQVPEGIYRVRVLNPRSLYHLALGLDYPNAFDEARGREDGRLRLGGDIMIHGDRVSDGCLPVGNDAIEELFALATRVGVENVAVIISPVDLRRVDTTTAVARASFRRPWVAKLYADLARRLQEFPLPAEDAGVLQGLRALHAGNTAARCAPYDAADCVAQCRSGDMASCARAGVLYSGGRGVTGNAAQAWALLNRSCASGNAFGCAALSELVLVDDGLRRDAARAADLARAACDGGDGHGCARLAKLCTDRVFYPDRPEECSKENVMRLRERAVAALSFTCEGWAAYDCYTLATIYAPGDPSTAVRLAAGSCNAGDPGACDLLGALYERGGDTRLARIASDRACRAGYASSCARIRQPGALAVFDRRQ
jgi:hypothetical protein